MPSQLNPCRLFILLARDAHRAVIFRRGPHLWTQIILWETDTDTFREGQWFKGTIYTKRCDLSPDGSKMIYFGTKHYKRYNPDAPVKNNLTVISHPPYLTALAMWDTSDTYGGGGYFEGNHAVYLNGYSQLPEQNYALPQGFEVRVPSPDRPIGLEDGIYYNVLLQNRGWRKIQGDFHWDESLHRYDNQPIVWQKDNPHHDYSLLMTLLGGYGNYAVWKYMVLNRGHEIELKIDNHAWADWDQRGRLVYSDAGQLVVGVVHSDRITSMPLADFNGNKPKLIQSPVWARTWDQH